MRIFGSYLPGAQEKDFYELDIASGSITRGFMAKHCDMYLRWNRSCGVSHLLL